MAIDPRFLFPTFMPSFSLSNLPCVKERRRRRKIRLQKRSSSRHLDLLEDSQEERTAKMQYWPWSYGTSPYLSSGPKTPRIDANDSKSEGAQNYVPNYVSATDIPRSLRRAPSKSHQQWYWNQVTPGWYAPPALRKSRLIHRPGANALTLLQQQLPQLHHFGTSPT